MRTMILEVSGKILYYSIFDKNTGAIVRSTESLNGYLNGYSKEISKNRKLLLKVFPKRGYTNNVCSPSPELIDISITNKCNNTCTYCYQSSNAEEPHGRTDLIEKILTGFDHIPYQIAIGGGEPTIHPDFINILYKAKELGTIPNYTTAGYNITPQILEATNETCGGMAISYHSSKGIEWFKSQYKLLDKNLTCQINVHLLADKNIITNMNQLIEAQKEIGSLNVVLLAYYPVGRASLAGLMTKTTYNKILPDLLIKALASGMKLSFSEGLLPYFNSRPQIGIDTKLAVPSEGHFSCYISSDGHMAASSFMNIENRCSTKTVYEVSAQNLWSELGTGTSTPYGDGCYGCPKRNRCSTPSDFHYLLCAHAMHNKK